MRGNAVPTIVWSSAASKSASITPMVARTLIRVVSSACGMGVSLLDAHRLDETQTQMAQLNQFGFAEALRQRGLGTGGLPPQRIDAGAALFRELGVDGAAIVRIIHTLDQAGGLVLQAHQDLEAALTEPELIRPTLHGRMPLFSQDADGGQRLRSRLDLAALPGQDLANPRGKQEAVPVGLQFRGVVIGLESE